MVQDTGLLNRRGVHAPPRVRIPPSPQPARLHADACEFVQVQNCVVRRNRELREPELLRARRVHRGGRRRVRVIHELAELAGARLRDENQTRVSETDGSTETRPCIDKPFRLVDCTLAPVAQWIRALASGAKGHRFESCRAYERDGLRAHPVCTSGRLGLAEFREANTHVLFGDN